MPIADDRCARRDHLDLPADRRLLIGWSLTVTGILLAFSCTCISIVLSHIGMAMAVCGWLVTRAPIQHLPGLRYGVAFALWQILSILVAQSHGGQSILRTGLGMTFVWFIFYLSVPVFENRTVRKWALTLLSIALGASVILALLQFFIGYGGVGTKPWRIWSQGVRMKYSSGFMPLHLTQGFIMAQFALLLLPTYGLEGLPFWQMWLLRVLAWAGVILANARSAFLGVAVGCASHLASGGRRLVLKSLLVLVVLMAGLGTWFWIWLPDTIVNMSSDGRWIHWRIASRMIAEHPWFGVGGANDYKSASDVILHRLYPDGSQNQWEQAPHAHNTFLAMAAEHGLPTVLFFLLFITAIITHLLRQRQIRPQGWRLGCALLACFILAGQFEPLGEHSSTSYVFYLTLAWAVALAQDPESAPGRGMRTSVPFLRD